MPNVVIYVVTPWYNLPNKTSPVDASALNHIETGIKNVTDFVNTLNVENGKVMGSAAFTTALLSKLNGIEEQANKYILPVATNATLGGVKVDNSTIVIENGVIRATTSGITELEELSDVNLTDLADGQILKYDSTSGKWVNSSEAEVRTQLSLLEDVDIDDTSLEDGQVLKYNGTSEKWENGEGGDVLGYDETLDVLGLPPNPVYKMRDAIPVMTSANTPSGEVSASSNYTNFYPWNAFRKIENNTVGWVTNTGDTVGAWIKYDFGSNKSNIVKLYVQQRNEGNVRAIKKFKFQASNDDTNWTDLALCEGLENVANAKYEFDINNPNQYQYYRLYATEVWDNSYVGFGDIRMYERYLA